MPPFSEDLKVILNALKTQREELILQMHLASVEAKDEWEKLEKKWSTFSLKAEKVLGEIKEASQDVEDDLKMLGDDLKEHYSHIKETIE
jgi:hypothetical protein